MKRKISKSQLIRLIRMDMINMKLLNHLSEISLMTEDYLLGIDEIVFEVMGLEKLPDSHLDQVFRNYVARSNKVFGFDILLEQEKIDKLSEEIYEYLITEVDLFL